MTPGWRKLRASLPARAGLEPDWQCLFANDFGPMKGCAYWGKRNGGNDLLVDEINNVAPAQLADPEKPT